MNNESEENDQVQRNNAEREMPAELIPAIGIDGQQRLYIPLQVSNNTDDSAVSMNSNVVREKFHLILK